MGIGVGGRVGKDGEKGVETLGCLGRGLERRLLPHSGEIGKGGLGKLLEARR